MSILLLPMGPLLRNLSLALRRRPAAPVQTVRPVKCLDLAPQKAMLCLCGWRARPQPAANSLRATPRSGVAAKRLLASCGPAANCATAVAHLLLGRDALAFPCSSCLWDEQESVKFALTIHTLISLSHAIHEPTQYRHLCRGARESFAVRASWVQVCMHCMPAQ